MRKNSNLAVFGARKGLLVAFEAQLCDVDACAVAGFLEYQARRLGILIKVLAHAGSLRTLTGEKCKTVFHVCSSKNKAVSVCRTDNSAFFTRRAVNYAVLP